MIPMTRESESFSPLRRSAARRGGVSRTIFVPAPVQTSVLVVTVATHPDDKPENSPRWCWATRSGSPNVRQWKTEAEPSWH